ncbi:MAG: hypothetical protein FWG72_01685 [Oscillospiraceae bacterium]|nr:hypothetical protein [Oscillospiraceae bacterium]
MKRIISLTLALVMALGLTTLPAHEARADEPAEINFDATGFWTSDQTGTGWSYAESTGVVTIADGANVRIVGQANYNQRIEVNGTATITLGGVTIDGAFQSQAGAMTVNGGANVTLNLGGSHNFFSAEAAQFGQAGIQVFVGATLTITGEGSLTATGKYGSGIGGGDNGYCGSISIGGDVTVTATGGTSQGAAGIGTGFTTNQGTGTITINGNATVTATGGSGNGYSPGIGGSSVIIGNDKTTNEEGTVIVTAIGGNGGGSSSLAGNVTVTGRYDTFTNGASVPDGGTPSARVNFTNNEGWKYVMLSPPAPDTVPPTLSITEHMYSHGHQDGRVRVSDNPQFGFRFDEEMDKGTIGTVAISPALLDGDVNIQSSGWSSIGMVRVYFNNGQLAYNTEYTITITGYKDLAGNPMHTFTHTFLTEYKPIASAAIVVHEPEIGETLNDEVISHDGETKNYTISKVTWVETGSGPKDGTIADNSYYDASVTLTKTDDEYEFTETFAATINGETATVASRTKDTITIRYVFSTGDTPIQTAAVSITAPRAGVAPSTTATADSAGFTCGTVTWNPADNPFEGETEYTATVTLTAKDKFVFFGTPTVTVNGKAATTVVLNDDDGTFTVTLTYKFPATGASGIGTIGFTDDSAPHINLAAETIFLPADFKVEAYSVDGGNKWKKGALPTGAKFSNLFNKTLELWVSDQLDDRGKAITKKADIDETKVIKFPKIEARAKTLVPKPGKLAPYYRTDDTWVLVDKGQLTAEESALTIFSGADGFEYGKLAKGAKEPADGYIAIPASGTAIVQAKADKETWLVRKAAYQDTDGKYYPASKAQKISPAIMGKVPSYKAPTAAKPVLKLKKGDFVSFTAGEQTVRLGSVSAKLDITIVHTVTDATKEIAGGTSITIWKAATGKKPASLRQTLDMPAITPPT